MDIKKATYLQYVYDMLNILIRNNEQSDQSLQQYFLILFWRNRISKVESFILCSFYLNIAIGT